MYNLYTVPDVHIRDLRIRALRMSLCKRHAGDKDRGLGKRKAKIRLSNSNVSFESEFDLGDGGITMEVENPVLWSAEDPQLYDLAISVYDEEGVFQEFIPEKVGFRRFEMKNNIMTLNGKRIVFKGANRHEFSSVTGRHVSKEELVKDLKTMKQNNINAIRTCHYPDSSPLYRLCDEYGLYLIDETNLETHGSWDTVHETGDTSMIVPNDRSEWLDMMLDRANSMYQRDKKPSGDPDLVLRK